MEVLKLMNTDPNWRRVLLSEPYNITIKEENEFVLLKYSQLNSDFNLPIVRECRGAIFTYTQNGWHCVRRAFDKFGNYGETYAAPINWTTASVQEKIDGSLVSVWYCDGWHLSTNGNIDAFKAPLGDFGISFGDYFCEALGVLWEEFVAELNPWYCYTYELVGPLNRIVISYEKPTLYAIGQRNMACFMEETIYDGPLGAKYNIFKPKRYNLYSLEEVVQCAQTMTRDEEGFVVCDTNFNRIKVKSLQYLTAARVRNNGVITKKRILQMLLDNTIDDFLAYCPQYSDYVNSIKNHFNFFLSILNYEATFAKDHKNLNDKEFWEAITAEQLTERDFVIKKKRNPNLTPLDYIIFQVSNRGIGWLDSRIEI